MITCLIKGGLGNQLFQIYRLLAYAITYNLNFYILETPTVGNRPSYWNTIFTNLKTVLRKQHVLNLIILEESQINNYTNDSIVTIMSKNNIIINGYFQNYKYFENVSNLISNILHINELCSKVAIKHPYKYKSTTSMHFRYGDYKSLSDHFNILEYSYYYSALSYILQNENPISITNNVLIFYEASDYLQVSNIVDRLKQNVLMSTLNFIYIDTNIPDYEQIFIMSNCKNNIIANSTFSWWGAYFNVTENPIRCYPSVWYRHKLSYIDTDGLHPPTWTCIESNA
jgi:hypothetical protein